MHFLINRFNKKQLKNHPLSLNLSKIRLIKSPKTLARNQITEINSTHYTFIKKKCIFVEIQKK